MNKQVRWGILGTATIAREAVIPAMRKPLYSEHLELTAIASRRLEKAQAMADMFRIKKAYGSYDALLADPDIDAVYIPLPNHLHVPLAKQALAAGKHVLCEKPIALSAGEASELVEAARQYPHLKLMEAFMYRHHPQWHWARQVVNNSIIGPVRNIHSIFSFHDEDSDSILHHPEWGGGALMDIGCYSISLSRFILQAEPLQGIAFSEVDPRFGVDHLTTGILQFAGVTSTFTCSTQAIPYQRVHILGTKGRFELEIPFNPPTQQPIRAWLEIDQSVKEISFEACDQYGLECHEFSRAIVQSVPVPFPIDDAVGNMRVIDALVRSTRSRTWEFV